jgi:chitodextrinase
MFMDIGSREAKMNISHSKKAVLLLIAILICYTFLSFLFLVPYHHHLSLAFRPTNPKQPQANNNNKNNITSPIVKPINHPPVANAGINQTVNENSPVTLNGIASDPDPTDNKLSYLWKQISGPRVKLINSNSANPSFVAPTVSSDRELKFSLTAKDEKGAASSNNAVVTITVRHVNHPPVANAGQENQTVNPGDIVTLDGSKSKDPDGDPLTYSWTQTAGPAVKLNDANTPIATFTAPSNISSDTTLGFRLTVKDDKNATVTADVRVIDKYIPPPNKPPVASIPQSSSSGSGSDFLSYENSKYGIKIDYPANWKVRENLKDNSLNSVGLGHEVVRFVKDSGTPHALVDIIVDNNPRTTNLNDYLQGYIVTLNAVESGHDFVYSSSNATISGSQALKVKFDVTPSFFSPPITLKSILMLTVIRDKAYAILYSAEPNFYSDQLQNAQHMIDSFSVSSSSAGSSSSPG